MFGSTFRENVFAERCGYFGVENTFLPEKREGIGVQYLSPLVAVVTSGISACKDVRELGTHAGFFDLWQNLSFVPCLFFVGADITVERCGTGVPGHVEQTEAYLTQTGISYIEVACIYQTLYQFVGNQFACLVVAGKGMQELFSVAKFSMNWDGSSTKSQ